MHEDCARAKANVHYTLSSPRAAFFTRLNTTPFLRRRDPGPFSSLRGDRHPLEASERLSHGFHARNWTGRIPGFKGRPNTVRCIAGKAHGRTIDKAIAHTITREFVILSLESLKETSPAFPPLQGAIGGLLKLVNTYEMMTQNVPYRQRLYERIDKIQDDLIFAWKDFDIRTCSLSDLQVRALESFEISIQHILDDANAILNSGMNPLRRFILAREHRSQLSDLVLRLANADDDFRRLIELDTNARITKMQLTSSEESAIIHRKLHDIQTLHARLFIFIPILFARDSGVGDTKIISCIVLG
ncbi:unnamed protein product [Peniophora sp. CBMAI 1063]|nr:unnamed protein product [Peniophora sp. CBMAI 1063]